MIEPKDVDVKQWRPDPTPSPHFDPVVSYSGKLNILSHFILLLNGGLFRKVCFAD